MPAPGDVILSPERRFQYKVYQRGDCWEWRGYRGKGGYGLVVWDCLAPTYAHRHAYELAKGPLSPHLQIDHLCRHSWCVKPSHLEAVTQLENMRRGENISQTHRRKTHCVHGHPFSPENTKIDHNGTRECQTCKARWRRDEMAKRRRSA